MEIKTNKPMLLLESDELGRYFSRLTDLGAAVQKRSANPGSEVVAVCTWDDLSWRWHLHGWLCMQKGEWECLPKESDAARIRDRRIEEAKRRKSNECE